MTTLAKADIELPWQVEVQQKAVPLLGCIICPRQGHHTIKKQVRTQETDSRPGSTNSSKFSKMLFLKSSIYKLVHQHMSRDRPAISPLGPQSVRTLRALNSRCAFSLSVTPHFRAMEIQRPNSSHSCHSRGRQVKEGLNLSPYCKCPASYTANGRAQICERTIKTSAPRPADDQTPSVKNNLPDFNAEAHSTGQLDQTQGSAWLARYNWHGSPGTRAKPECPKGDPDLVSDPPAPASAVSRPRSSGSGPSAAAKSARAATTTSPSSADPHARHKRPGRVAAGWCSALVPQIKEQGCSSKHDKTGYWA